MSEIIIYSDQLDQLTPLQLDGFFVGWPNPPSNAKRLKILQGSYAVWLAYDGGTLVGLINAISDGVLTAHIPLLEVLPSHQGRGIGSVLVKRMQQSLANLYAIDVVCDDDVKAFYKKLGLFECNAMILRNYAAV